MVEETIHIWINQATIIYDINYRIARTSCRKKVVCFFLTLHPNRPFVFPLQCLSPWHPLSSDTWLPPFLANWPRWASQIRCCHHQQPMLSDASAPSPQLLVHFCLQWTEVPSRPPHAAPPLNVVHLCWDSVSISPASSLLQEWKPNLLWRGVAKTVSLFWGGGVFLSTAKLIQDTSNARAKI